MDDKFDKWSNNGENKTIMYFSISTPSLIRWQAMLWFIFFVGMNYTICSSKLYVFLVEYVDF